MSYTHLSLFSGIGGVDLAAHWADFRTVAFVEQDIFCQAVLRKNFGEHIPIFSDVQAVTARALWSRGVDWPFLVSGGFPCTDVSIAGLQAGLGTEDAPTERSGLWYAMLGVIRDVRPRYVLVENVRNLVNRGIDTVLGGLEQEGYTCWAGIMGAESVGAPHKRERVFIVGFNGKNDGAGWGNMADSDGLRQSQPEGRIGNVGERVCDGSFSAAGVAQFGDACRCGRTGGTRRRAGAESADGHSHALEAGQGNACADGELADAPRGESDGGRCRRLEQASAGGRGTDAAAFPCRENVADANNARQQTERNQPGIAHVLNAAQCRSVEVADAQSTVFPNGIIARRGRVRASSGGAGQLADAHSAGWEQQRRAESNSAEHAAFECSGVFRWPSCPGQPQHNWESPRTVASTKSILAGTKSSVGASTDGISAGLVRYEGRQRRLALKAAGNAVVPQQIYPVLRAIADHAGGTI